jgi:hypothetical protein
VLDIPRLLCKCIASTRPGVLHAKWRAHVAFALLAGTSACIASIPAFGQPSSGFKQVSFDDAMTHQLNRSLPLTLGFPDGYAMLDLDSVSGVIWGTPDELAEARKTNTVPQRNGYFYGRLTPNTGYDDAKGEFICGVDCDETDIPKQFSDLGIPVKMERARANGIPLLFLEADTSKMKGAATKKIYMAYIATLVDTNVFLISYRPPSNSDDQGAAVWAYFKKSLAGSP